MRIQNNSITFLVEYTLKTKKLDRQILEKALVLINEAIEFDCCDEDSLNLITPREDYFVSLIIGFIRLYKGSKNINGLTRIRTLIQQKLAPTCCNSIIELSTNHVGVITPSIDGYASLESGGNRTDFTLTLSGVCSPYSAALSIDFGSGYTQIDTIVGVGDTSFNQELSLYLIGKTIIHPSLGTVTIIPNDQSAGAGQANINRLNGRAFTLKADVTNCLGDITTDTVQGEMEMKRVVKPVIYQKLLNSGGCDCAELPSEIYTDRRGGGNHNANGLMVGHTVPTNSIATQNVFNTYPVGGANAKWRIQDCLSQLGGFNNNILFRTPVIRIADARWLSGNASDQNCLYSFILLETDIRDGESVAMTGRVHFSSINCATEPFVFNSGIAYNTGTITYSYPVEVNNILVAPFSDTYQVINLTTPAELGW